MKPASLVYFLRPVGQAGPVKIGCSSVPVERLAMFMQWSPVKLEIAATFRGDDKLERRIHGIFADQHSHSEWFYPSSRLSDFIASLASGVPIETLVDLTGPVRRFRQRAPISFERRQYRSYAARIRHAFRRLDTGDTWSWPIEDVRQILYRWAGNRHGPSVQPSADDLALLDRAIADPAAHAEIHQRQKWAA